MNITPITLEVFKNKFASVAEEMGVALTRTAYSPNIKERRDFSCAVFDSGGDMIAQAAHIPVHLGSMPLSVRAAIDAIDLGPGDMAMLNDPFRGGTHLPDITLVAPVHAGGDAPLFYVACRAHHADVGGMAAGSMPLSTSIFQEGLVIPPIKIVAEGEIVQGVMDLFLANVRTPQERQGDFAAQIMANRVGVARMEALVAAYGREAVTAMSAALMDYAERLMQAAITAIPDGTYEANMRFSLYRWHIADPVRFERDLKVTIQALGWRRDGRYLPLRDDIASVAFWYQTLPAAPFPELPPADELEIF